VADEPTDINKARRREERDTEVKTFLIELFTYVVEAHNTIKMRTKDIERDLDELYTNVENKLTELHEKYPEYMPEIEEEEFEDS